MDSKFIGALIVVALVAGGGGYFAGTKNAGAQSGPQSGQRIFTRNGGGGRFGGAGAAFGTIVAKDATSITVQLMGGPNASSTNGSATGSKIVLYNTTTEIGKTVTGADTDLKVGENVVVNGSANSDGSITAQMIQIRPAGMNQPFGRRQQ